MNDAFLEKINGKKKELINKLLIILYRKFIRFPVLNKLYGKQNKN